MDNIGVFDRSAKLPTGGRLEQADGTGWMAMYTLNMLRIACEISLTRPVYQDMAGKFFEHFLYIAEAKNHAGDGSFNLWDDEDQFFYDVLRLPEGSTLLASNAHSEIQAAVIPLGKTQVWAVQYHPEYDLQQVLAVYSLYADDMVGPDFFADHAELDAYCEKLRTLIAHPGDAGAAWQLGIDADVLDDRTRRGEIISWIETQGLGTR